MSTAWSASLSELDKQFSDVAMQTRLDGQPMLHWHLLNMVAAGPPSALVMKSDYVQIDIFVFNLRPELDLFFTKNLIPRKLKQLTVVVQENHEMLRKARLQNWLMTSLTHH